MQRCVHNYSQGFLKSGLSESTHGTTCHPVLLTLAPQCTGSPHSLPLSTQCGNQPGLTSCVILIVHVKEMNNKFSIVGGSHALTDAMTGHCPPQKNVMFVQMPCSEMVTLKTTDLSSPNTKVDPSMGTLSMSCLATGPSHSVSELWVAGSAMFCNQLPMKQGHSVEQAE